MQCRGGKELTREETKKIIRIMCDCYPNYRPADLSETVDVWTMMLSEHTYHQISMALKAYVLTDTSGFAPSIGQLTAKAQALTSQPDMNEMEAWSLVSKAVRNSIYNSESEYGKFPDSIKKAVGSASQLRIWAGDENYNEQVVSSNFMRSYRQVIAQEKELNKLPSDVRNMIESASAGRIPEKSE